MNDISGLVGMVRRSMIEIEFKNEWYLCYEYKLLSFEDYKLKDTSYYICDSHFDIIDESLSKEVYDSCCINHSVKPIEILYYNIYSYKGLHNVSCVDITAEFQVKDLLHILKEISEFNVEREAFIYQENNGGTIEFIAYTQDRYKSGGISPSTFEIHGTGEAQGKFKYTPLWPIESELSRIRLEMK